MQRLDHYHSHMNVAQQAPASHEKAMLDPRPALDAAVDANHSSMSELESVLSGLEQRLQSVLRQPVPQTAGGATPQPVPDICSPSVESLRTLRQRLTASILRVHDLMDRLET